MQRPFLTVTVALAMMTIGGCSTVRSLHPVGQPLEETQAENIGPELAEAFDGVWQAGEGVFHLRYIGGSTLRIAWIEWTDEKFELHQTTAIIGVDQEIGYVSLLDPQSPAEQPAYYFARVTGGSGQALWLILAPAATGEAGPGSGSLVLYPPRAETFARAVDERVLLGRVEKRGDLKSVHLATDKETLDAFIDPAKAAEQFDFNSPIVLRRIVTSQK
jgi:hypothetical protein